MSRTYTPRPGSFAEKAVEHFRAHPDAEESSILAMQAIGDSMRVASTKPYIRFYKRDATTGEYFPISLDVAAI